MFFPLSFSSSLFVSSCYAGRRSVEEVEEHLINISAAEKLELITLISCVGAIQESKSIKQSIYIQKHARFTRT